LGVDDLDLLEINASDNNGIDDMRQLIEALSYHGFGDSRAVILDESHLLSNSAQNSILKLLEEPPKDTYIFLCTTDPQKLLRTILSRCIQLEVHPLNDRVMLKKLKGVVESEKLNLSTDVLEVIVEKAEGVPRVALKLMDKVDGMDEATALTTLAKESSVSDIIDPDVGNLCRAFLKKESWKEISAILRTLKGQDPEAVRRQVLGYMAAVLLNRGDAAPAIVMSYFVDSFFTSGYGGLVYACFGATQ
jgi:DNA polymerase-3 subunit gamma/tau